MQKYGAASTSQFDAGFLQVVLPALAVQRQHVGTVCDIFLPNSKNYV